MLRYSYYTSQYIYEALQSQTLERLNILPLPQMYDL